MIGKVAGVAVAVIAATPIGAAIVMRRYFTNPLDVLDRIGAETIEYFEALAEELYGPLPEED